MTVWLIEWPEDDNVPVRWWNPATGWMRDANKAMHFVRKQDAEDFIAGFARGFVGGVKATEHKFCDNLEIPSEIEKLRLQLVTCESTIQTLVGRIVKAHAVLEQCQQCIRGDTPEDVTDEEAREDTISKIREIILSDERST